MPNVLRGNVQTKHSGAVKDRRGSQEIFSEKLCLRMNRNELKMKGPSLKQDATSEKVRPPGGQIFRRQWYLTCLMQEIRLVSRGEMEKKQRAGHGTRYTIVLCKGASNQAAMFSLANVVGLY